MGSGKSSVGRELARRLECEFIDTDARVAELARAPVAEIFARHGEARFRDLESAVLEGLPERQRMAIWLTAVEGRPYAEVASVLETSVGSVKSLVHRARASLADSLAERPAKGRPERAGSAEGAGEDRRETGGAS